MNKTTNTPKKVYENGKFLYGVYNKEFEELNISEGNFFNGLKNTKTFKNFRLKEYLNELILILSSLLANNRKRHIL